MKKIVWIVPITITIVVLMALISERKNDSLVAPELVSSPTPVPTSNTPKTFNFDSQTNLKAELEKINPQILESDFE